jgi:HEAT repeat protein
LRDPAPEVRQAAAAALEAIEDPRAVEPLASALRDPAPEVRRAAAAALEKILYKKHPLYLGREEMRIKSPQALDALDAAMHAKDLDTVAGAYRYYIRQGESGTEDLLIKVLNTYGDTDMAVVFLNCGNAQLKEAARIWAEHHHYQVVERSPFVFRNAMWGSLR